MNKQEHRALIDSIDRSLALLAEKSGDSEFERQIYDDLARVREMLRQSEFDLSDEE